MDGNLLDGLTDSEGRQVHNPEATFSQALADAAARGGREAPAETRTDPALDSADTILRQVAGGGESVVTKDVQLALAEGNPSKPTEAKLPALEDLEALTIDGERVRGADVKTALDAGGEAVEAAEYLAEEDAIQAFLEATEDGDGGSILAATVELNAAVEDGTVSLEEAGNLIREAIVAAYNIFPEDLEEDPELAEMIEAAYVETIQSASQIVEAKQAKEDHEAARAAIPELAAERAKQAVDIARQFGRDAGIGEVGKSAEATRIYNEAVELATALYVERSGVDPEDPREKLDTTLWKECLHAASAAEREAQKAEATNVFHQQFLGIDLSEGYTLNGVKQDPRELPEPVLDEKRVVARAAMRRSSAADIRRSMAATESTDVQEALKAGRPR